MQSSNDICMVASSVPYRRKFSFQTKKVDYQSKGAVKVVCENSKIEYILKCTNN